MRRPYVASARSLKKLLRKKQAARPSGSMSAKARASRSDHAGVASAALASRSCIQVRLPAALPSVDAGAKQAPTTAEAAKGAAAEPAVREPVSCGFGAVRVGALLGRLRLHLQTERFLAVHRGDAVWEAGCLQAALALAEIVAHMGEREMAAGLPQAVILSPPAALTSCHSEGRFVARRIPLSNGESERSFAPLRTTIKICGAAGLVGRSAR